MALRRRRIDGVPYPPFFLFMLVALLLLAASRAQDMGLAVFDCLFDLTRAFLTCSVLRASVCRIIGMDERDS